ncbi:metal dependent phosphohydrolase [Carboxydocella thermautotrophica]|nr:metal dependent phosphohydrolase [Carboxydocella thermautotrophica]
MQEPIKAKLLNWYVVILSIVTGVILLYTLNSINFSQKTIINTIIFSLIYFIIELFPVHLPRGGSVSVSIALTVAILYLFDLPVAIFTVFIGECLIHLKSKNKKIIKTFFNFSQLIISITFSGIIKIGLIKLGAVYATIIAAFCHVIINLSLVTIVLALSQNAKPYGIWMLNFKWVAPNFIALTPMGILMAKIYETWGAVGIILFILPLMLARHSFKLYMDTRQMYLDTVQALVTAIEAKDLYTKGHSERVAEFAVETARELDWPEHKIETLRYMALLHDIGKIAIPDVILNKSTRLSPQEYNRIKDHAVVWAEIIKQVKNLGDAYLMVRHHHERMDGSGYPDGLKGEEIPMGARIIAVADCFDAMTSNRVYRAGRSPREAIQELQKCGGAELDSQVVQAFVQAWEKRLAPKWEKQILTEIETGAARGEIAAAQAEE